MIHIDQGSCRCFVLWPNRIFSTHYRYMRSNIMIIIYMQCPGIRWSVRCVTLWLCSKFLFRPQATYLYIENITMINILTPKITVFCTQCRHSSSDLADTYSEFFYFFESYQLVVRWQVDLKFLLHKLKQLTTNSCISPFPMFTYNIVRLICTLSMFFFRKPG